MPRRIPTPQPSEKYTPDARGQAVLAAMIKEHLVTGEAVGSRVLSIAFPTDRAGVPPQFAT